MRSGILGMLLILVAWTMAQADTINVPGDHPIIQDAIDAATPGDIVLIAAGVYGDLHQPPGADTTLCVASMKSGITLRGAGIGQTIIDPDFGGRGIYCFEVTNAQIEGITVRHAFAELYGAGLYCTQNSSPTVIDCEFTGCTDGGVICSFGSSPELDSCLITDNESKQGGGIAAEDGSSPHVIDSTISGNAAPAGGGVFVRAGSAPLFENTVISGNYLNTDNGAGGGIGVINAQLTLRSCDVIDNVASGPGGGIAVIDEGLLELEDCRILRNSTTDSYGPGGGIHCESSVLMADHTLIADNWVEGASSDGGGVYFFFAEGGGLWNCTVVGNRTHEANGHGGGVACFLASPTIEASILAFNLAGMGLYCVDGSSVPQVSCTDLYGNAEGDGICGDDVGGNFSLDPEFCDVLADDYSLSSDSPCLPGAHPNGDDCGQIGAFGLGTCDTGDLSEGSMGAVLRSHLVSPNPFGPITEIRFVLEAPARVRLAVYGPSGQVVRRLEDRGFPAGEHGVRWDSRDDKGALVPSGLYFYSLDVGGRPSSGRLVLAR